MTRPKAKAGDWIRFYRGGTLVLGVVAYVRKDDLYGHAIICADCGEVDPSDVLEVRSSPPIEAPK